MMMADFPVLRRSYVARLDCLKKKKKKILKKFKFSFFLNHFLLLGNITLYIELAY